MIVIEIVLHETNIWKWRRAVVVFHVKLAQSTKMRFCEVDKVLEDTLDDEIHETDNYHRQHQGWDGRQRSISWRSKTTHGSAVSPIRVCWGHTRKKDHNLCLQNDARVKHTQFFSSGSLRVTDLLKKSNSNSVFRYLTYRRLHSGT